MITFECPGCTKPLEANRAFAGFDTRCLRCGSVIRIPGKSGDQVETLAKSGLPKPRPAPPRPAPRPAPVSEPAFDSTPTPPPVATLEAPAKRRSLKAESAPDPAPSANPEPAKPAAKKKSVKKKRMIFGAVGGVALVAVLAYAFMGGKKPAKASPRRDDSTPSASQNQNTETPKQPVEAPKKDVTPPPVLAKEPAPMPRAVRPQVEYELTAAALLQEYGEGPVACNEKYDGKDLFVRGVFHSCTLGKLTLLAGDEKSTPINFTLLLPTDLKLGETLPDPGLKPGQPVVLRGTYNAGCRFTSATIELTDSPAERAYLGKSVCLDGAFVREVQLRSASSPNPMVVLEPHATDSKIGVTCHFHPMHLEQLKALKPGRSVTIQGRCVGRTFTTVSLHNCSIVIPEDPQPGAEVSRMPADKFFTEYESDLLPAPRPSAAEAIPVTAEGLGHAYQIDPKSANITYRNRLVQLSGYVRERHAATRMLVFQCGTDSSFSVAAFFSPQAFENLTQDKTMVIRGVCSGPVGGYIRVDSADYAEIRQGDDAKRTDTSFLPFRIGKEHIVDHLVPGRGKESAVKRIAIRFNGTEDVLIMVQKTGTITGNTLLREPYPEPKWSVVQPKYKPMMSHYRIRDGVVEIRREQEVTPEKGKREIVEFWEPVLKAGLRRGQSWSAKLPEGTLATYTVVGITRPEGAAADHLEIKRVVRDPRDPTRWEETVVTYVRDLGEVRRVMMKRNDRGEAETTMEMRLVSDGVDYELRSQPKK